VKEGKGNRIVGHSSLLGISEVFACKRCGKEVEVNESFSVRSGIITSLESTCKVCSLKYKFTNPRSAEATALNKLSVLGSRSAGIGRTRLDRFTGVMSLLPPVATKAFSKYNKEPTDVVVSTAESILLHLYNVDRSEVLSVAVSGDGTWMKRGHVSRYGIYTYLYRRS